MIITTVIMMMQINIQMAIKTINLVHINMTMMIITTMTMIIIMQQIFVVFTDQCGVGTLDILAHSIATLIGMIGVTTIQCGTIIMVGTIGIQGGALV